MTTNFHPTNFTKVLHDIFTGNPQNYPNDFNSNYSRVNFYSGQQPNAVADAFDSQGGVFLGSTNSLKDYFGPPSGGVSRLLFPSMINVTISGTVEWARFYSGYYSSSTRAVIDTPVSLTGNGGGMIVDDLAFVASDVSTLEKLAFFLPETLGTVSLSLALRNQILDSFINGQSQFPNVGQQSILSIYTGSLPSSIYDTATGTKLADFESASSSTGMWSVALSSGESVISSEGSWNTVTTVGAGVPGYFRLVKGDLVMQGTCSTGGADMSVDKASVIMGDSLTISEGTLIAA